MALIATAIVLILSAGARENFAAQRIDGALPTPHPTTAP